MTDTSLNQQLRLYEEILLLALKDNTGRPASGLQYSFAIGGAAIAELLLEKRVTTVVAGKKTVLQATSEGTVGDPFLDDCLDRVRSEQKQLAVQTWISKIGTTKGLLDIVAEGLCSKEILRQEEKKVMGLFKRKYYPEKDHKPEAEILDRLRNVIFNDAIPDSRTILLISLARPAGLLTFHFGKKEIKKRKERLDNLVSGEILGEAIQEAINAVIQVVVSSATTAAVTSH